MQIWNPIYEYQPCPLYNSLLRLSLSYNVPLLRIRQAFSCRARSRNKAGLSDASNIIYLKTNGDSPSPLVGGPEPSASAGVWHTAGSFILITAGLTSSLQRRQQTSTHLLFIVGQKQTNSCLKQFQYRALPKFVY